MDKKFIKTYNVDDYEVLTDTGWEDIKFLHKTIKYKKYIVYTENFSLECADNHWLFDKNMERIYVKNLSINDEIFTENGFEKIILIEKTNDYENMYDLELYEGNRRFYTNGILSSNTTSYIIYLLWLTIFHSDKKALICANKHSSALEFISRIRFAYELLPLWLKPGLKVWNKGKIEFSNESSIEGSSTSSDSARGRSCNILVLDECVDGEGVIDIKNKKTGEIRKIKIEDLYNDNEYK